MNTNFGSKINNLKKLQDSGFSIPDFCSFAPNDLEKYSVNELAVIAHNKLHKIKYAVRSSAFIEDGKKSSNAGMFLTKLDIKANELSDAIKSVLDDAIIKLGSLDNFSIFIQEYIQPDIAGVVFTRNPKKTRDFVLEYVKGSGDILVSGLVKPKVLNLYRNKEIYNNKFGDLIKTSLKIESVFNFPQDIEWCKKHGIFYILQSRPITTMSKNDIDKFLFLDEILSDSQFYFEKNEITEVASQPTRLTFKILKLLYSNSGPVFNIYKKYNIDYRDTDFLKIIDGQLFVDKEKELHSLYPSMTYFNDIFYRKTFGSLSGILKTIKNLINFKNIKCDVDDLLRKIQYAFKDYKLSSNIDVAIDVFLKQYELIFEINLNASILFADLQNKLHNKYNLTEILSKNVLLDDEWIINPPKNLTGNTLEIFDDSKFEYIKYKNHDNLNNELKDIKFFIVNAKKAQLLREYGRWLMLLHINGIKKLSNNDRDRDVNRYELPNVLTYKFFEKVGNNLGLSDGTAKGVVVGIEDVENVKGDKILFVNDITPDLTKYFNYINGIITLNGGILSHFSILAREADIPLVRVTNSNFIGKKITINGNSGDIFVE